MPHVKSHTSGKAAHALQDSKRSSVTHPNLKASAKAPGNITNEPWNALKSGKRSRPRRLVATSLDAMITTSVDRLGTRAPGCGAALGRLGIGRGQTAAPQAPGPSGTASAAVHQQLSAPVRAFARTHEHTDGAPRTNALNVYSPMPLHAMCILRCASRRFAHDLEGWGSFNRQLALCFLWNL